MGKFQNYELNEEQRRIEQLKYQRRMDLRAQFWKNMTDPNRHGSGEGGALFDPALYRFQAMRVAHTEHFKPTGKAAFWGFAILIIPMTLLFTLSKREIEAKEKRFRNGEVSYADREFKFV